MTAAPAAEFDAWIGRTIEATDIVTPRLVEGYRATFAPHLAPLEAESAPLGVHWCLAPHTASMAELGPDGHPARGGFMPPVPLPRRMWAGGEVEFLVPLRIGDHVKRRSTIAAISAKQGRSGPLYLVEIRHEFSVDAHVSIRERQDVVYRNTETRVSAADRVKVAADTTEASDESELTWSIEASPVRLFRYSALTFNGHRIHYDQPYATAVEGYDGLVVHGPLQASLLLNLTATLLRRCPARFTVRAVAPLVSGRVSGRVSDRPFKVCGAREGEGLVHGRVQDATGRVTCQATAAGE